MSRLARDGTAEPISRDQKFSGANGDRENMFFPVQLTTSRIGNLTRLILTLALCDDPYTYILYLTQDSIHTYSTLPQDSVYGHHIINQG